MTAGLADLRTGRRQVLVLGGAAALEAAAPLMVARAADGPTLLYGVGTYPATMRPFASSGNTGNGIKLMIHRGLTSFDPQGMLQPELAESWSQPNDHEFIFQLRKAKFHNGDDVTAADVQYSLNQIIRNDPTAFLKGSFAVVSSVDVLDPQRVRIVLSQPVATFLELLGSVFVPIISAKSADVSPEDPIGCGPFTIASRSRGEAIVVRRFPQYYKPGLPKVETIRCIYYADENLRAAAVASGSADVIEQVPWQSITGLDKNPAVRCETDTGGYYYLLFNFKSGRFTDPRLRQAAGFAVDREAIMQAAFYGHGKPLYGLPIPDGPAFSGAMAGDPFNFDLKKAKQLMAAAGYPNGFTINMMIDSTVTAFQRAGEVVQQNLMALGIQINIQLADYARVTTSGSHGEYEMRLYGNTGFYNDPDAISPMLIGPPSYLRSYGYSSPRVEGLLEAGRTELDSARRRVIYADLQKACGEEAPLVGLSWRAQGFAMKSTVKGFRNMPHFLSTYSPIQMETISLS
jgi:peptide/nickel transport system substrate-binding protein